MPRNACRFLMLALLLAAAARASADDVLLSVAGAPPDGLVVARVDLAGALAWCKLPAVVPAGMRAVLDKGGKPVPFQFVPDAEFDGTRHAAGTVILRLPGPGDALVRLTFGAAAPEEDKPFDGTVTTSGYSVTHDPKRQGGFPSPIVFRASGKRFEAVRWADRVYHRELGSFNLAADAEAQVRRVAAGPLATVVRVRGRYVQGVKRPDSQPEAVYDWYYFPDRPLVYVTAALRQARPFTWHETHFLEITTPGKDFLHWAGGEPIKQGAFTGTGKGFHFPDWGALVEGRDAIGMFRCGQALFYDQPGGTYLQAHGDAAWREWPEVHLARSAWLWIGSGDDPARAVQAAAAGAVPADAHAVVLVKSVHAELAAARQRAAGLEGQARSRARLSLAAAEQLAAAGRFAECIAAARGQLPATWTVLRAGDLEAVVERTADGLRLVSLHEVASGRELAATKALPLFRVTLRHAQTKEELPLAADAGWGEVKAVGHVSNVPGTDSREGVGSLFRPTRLPLGQSVKKKILPTPSLVEIRWQRPMDPRVGDLRVVARVTPDTQASALRWTLSVENVRSPWGVWRVVFPQVAVAEMAKTLGVPIGFHWYGWHQIPFDNDYPHYFPTRPGFAESVARLQKAGVYVMPYINGRLWDTHDKGAEEFQFSKLARPAATKDEKGDPYVEMYGSKEADGQRVRLAVMCPSTELWQKTVRGIVLRLMNECGVKGVYIDQVAAAGPRLCFDRSHGHPLGGGHWWTEGYWKLLGAMRREMPKDRMITTECNAEPYISSLDGYLTWHWQYQDQVPAFPAVYGGAIQMFGRAYRGGPTEDLALRMKAGEQLVFGEQLGWLAPGQLSPKENLDFFRSAVRLRWRLRRYFYAGEMARPPALVGKIKIPRVTADWQWSGVWPVTTDAVMAGAWRIVREKKLVLLFTNVSDEPVTARVEYDAGEYGFAGPAVKVTRVAADASGEGFTSPPKITREVAFPPRAVWAWEVAQP